MFKPHSTVSILLRLTIQCLIDFKTINVCSIFEAFKTENELHSKMQHSISTEEEDIPEMRKEAYTFWIQGIDFNDT